MEWLFILGLLGWAGLQSARIGELSRKLAAFESRFAAPAPAPAPRQEAPLPFTRPLAPEDDEPLLLDTPLPDASNDDTPMPMPALPPRAQPPPPRERKQLSRRLERWLAEKGLAWLAGGALALGGIYLVSLATRQGWFTPEVRLTIAALLGAGLIGLSEFLRRVGLKRPPGHPLAAALCAGAGVVAFYATAWAAHAFYGFLDWRGAAAALTLCALALIGLSFLHGQALGVLAIVAALLAPALTGVGAWPAGALTLYVCAVGTAGFALAILQRWAWNAAATLAGLYLWFAASIAADDIWRALALLSFASVGGIMVAARTSDEEPPSWARARAIGPAIAVCVSSVLLIWTWLAIAAAPADRILGPALISVFHVALAAYAVRGRAADASVLTIAAGALVFGFFIYARGRFYFGPLGGELYAAALFAGLAIALMAFAAKPHHQSRALIACSGAIGFALLTALAAFTRENWRGLAAWAALFVGAAIMLAAAERAARDASDAENDLATDSWAGAGAALLLLGVESAFAEPLRVAADSAVALLLAAGFARRGWRALRLAAPSAAALALGHALSPEVWSAALAGAGSLLKTLALLGFSAGLLFWAGRLAARRTAPALTDEALGLAGALALLIGAFLVLQYFASRAGTPLDALTGSALRALTLLTAGHILTPRQGAPGGLIALWRGHALLAAGLVWALVMHGIALNPWWGAAPAVIPGPVLFNVQALAYAAPAALAFAAARRLYQRQTLAARLYAGAGALLSALWIMLELRHAFQGANMHAPGFVGLEGFAHTLWPLALWSFGARLLGGAADAARRRDARAFLEYAAWPALLWAALGLWLIFNPWWGAAPAQLGANAAMALGAYLLAAWLSSRAPRAHASAPFAGAATIISAGHLFIAATLAVRYVFHSAAYASAPASEAEMWSYSAAWALFGAGAFWLGARRGDARLRWSGLAILVATTAYVAFLALTRLTDMARVGSLLGLAVILLAVTWYARTAKLKGPVERT